MSEPAGIVMPFAGSTAPEGWLLCDGSAVSRSTYADLFAAIGTTYGSGDGSGTFNLPDLSGRVVIGVSQSHALGSTGGEATHVLTSSELPVHVHEVPQHGHGNDIAATTPELSHTITQPVFKYNRPNGGNATSMSIQTVWAYNSTANASATRSANLAISDHDAADCTMSGAITDCDSFNSGESGSDLAHNNLQPYLAVKYIISTGE